MAPWSDGEGWIQAAKSLTPDHWRVLPAMIAKAHAALRGDPSAIKPVLARLALACRAGAAESVDRKAQAALFLEFLSPYPPEIVSEAANEWIRTKVFFPAVSELAEICERLMAPRRRAVRRLQALKAKQAELDAERNVKRPTPEEMEAIKAEIAKKWPTKREAVAPRLRDLPHAEIRARMESGRERMRDELTALNRKANP